jgi:hypothetical protein
MATQSGLTHLARSAALGVEEAGRSGDPPPLASASTPDETAGSSRNPRAGAPWGQPVSDENAFLVDWELEATPAADKATAAGNGTRGGT